MKHTLRFVLPLALLSACAARADITLTCERATLHLSEKAVPTSLVLRDGTECLDRVRREPLAEVQSANGAWHPAATLRQMGHTLLLGFSDTDTTLSLAAETPPDWIALRVASFGGTRPKAVRFVMLNSAFNETVGRRLNIGWNSAHALCVMAASPLTDTQVTGQATVSLEETVAAVNRGEGGVNPRVRLTAKVQDAPGTQMEGASAAIIACPTPDFKKVAQKVAHTFGLPTSETASGQPVKETELAQSSTLFLCAGLGDVDKLISLCNEAGIRQVLLNSDAWCTPADLYAVNTQHFPNGLSDLKAFVARLKAAGITAGLHCTCAKLNTGDAGGQSAPDTRLAEIFNACGFGMVYFDSVTTSAHPLSEEESCAFQTRALRSFNRPFIHLGATLTPILWHSLARSPAGVSYLHDLAGQPTAKGPTVKQHIDTRVSCMLSLRGDMMPGELGWFGVWPRQQRYGREVEGLQLDELEYLLCRSVAYDCPASLQTSFSDLQKHPLAPDLLRLFKLYETARLAHRFSEADKAPMREPGHEFTLVQRRGFAPALVPVRPVACGRSRNTHAMVGAFEGGSVATFWHATSRADVTLDLSPFIARIADFDDERVVAQKSADEKLVLPVTTRRLTLFCPTLDVASLEQKIKNSLSTEAVSGL